MAELHAAIDQFFGSRQEAINERLAKCGGVVEQDKLFAFLADIFKGDDFRVYLKGTAARSFFETPSSVLKLRRWVGDYLAQQDKVSSEFKGFGLADIQELMKFLISVNEAG